MGLGGILLLRGFARRAIPGIEHRSEMNERREAARSGRWVGLCVGGGIQAKTGLSQRDRRDSASGRVRIRHRIMVESVLGVGSGGEWAVVLPILELALF